MVVHKSAFIAVPCGVKGRYILSQRRSVGTNNSGLLRRDCTVVEQSDARKICAGIVPLPSPVTQVEIAEGLASRRVLRSLERFAAFSGYPNTPDWPKQIAEKRKRSNILPSNYSPGGPPGSPAYKKAVVQGVAGSSATGTSSG